MEFEIPRPIKVETTPVKVEVIDLDDYTSTEEQVHRWHKKICNKIKSLFGDTSEESLDTLMKWYIETLNEDIFDLETCQSLLNNMDRHLQFFHSYFKELNWTSLDDYLDNMEDILAIYLDLQCQLFTKEPKKRKKYIRDEALKLLKVYLLHQEDRLYHVLMKIKINFTCSTSKKFLDTLFRVMLSRIPTNNSDLAFCRAYILHQRWKKVQNPEMYATIDEILFKNYSRTVDIINTNPVIKEVLHPENNSVLDVFAHIMDNDKPICDSYFKYVKLQKTQDVELDVGRIDLDCQSSSVFTISTDTEEFSLDNLSHQSEIETQLDLCTLSDGEQIETCDELKTEVSDDECLIVGEGTVNCSPEETEMVHEILDDDDDIAAIIYFTTKDSKHSNAGKTKNKPEEEEVSFLNSINITDTSPNKETCTLEKRLSPILPSPPTENTDIRTSDDSIEVSEKPDEELSFLNSVSIEDTGSNKDTNFSESRSLPITTSPTSPKLQNSDNDSVKSREILSRKFTRKKDNIVNNSDAMNEDNVHCTELETDNSDWDRPKPNSNTCEPSHVFEGLVTPPTSHDDQHSYERDFHNSDLQEIEQHVEENCFEDGSGVKDTETDCHIPHSTIPNNSDMCNTPASAPEKISSESYVSPTSPDISSTFEPNSLAFEEDQDVVPNEVIDNTAEVSRSIIKDIASADLITNEIRRVNGNIIENNNNKEDKKDPVEKQLKVSVPRIELTKKSTEKTMEVLFTYKQNKDNDVHLRYSPLKGDHGLDDCLRGDLKKVSCPTNMVNNFDLFDDTTPVKEHYSTLTSPQQNTNSTSSPSSIVSPDYDGIDDFKNYLANYQQENIKKAATISKKPEAQEKAATLVNVEDQQARLKSDNKNILTSPTIERTPERQVKKKRIAFAKEDVVNYLNPHEPILKSNNRIQGILKKTTPRTRRWRITKDQMNLHSLSHYRVKPNDPCLQGEPCVVIERLSETEISEWQRYNESARKLRLHSYANVNKTLHSHRNNVTSAAMTMLRVDYDKSTPWLTESDTVLYRVPEGTNWRTNTHKIDLFDEGTVESNSEEYFYIPTICKNTCCSNLIAEFKKLTLTTTNNETSNDIPNIPINPFCLRLVGKNKTTTEDKSSFIDLNVVNKIVENFDKCNEPINPFDFINQPAIVPEVEEFEKTLKMEEVTKVSPIPSDLHNLNLRKFSPSPVMNCFSPHSSPAYTYFSDCSNFNDRFSSFQESEELEIENNLVLDNQETVYTKEEVSNKDLESKIWITVSEKLHDPQDIGRQEEVVTTEEKVTNDQCDINNKDSKLLKTDVEEEPETRLPLKKRKHSVANAREADSDEEAIGPEAIEEIIKQARAEENEKEDISYPAKPAISIAEIQEKLEPQTRTFKTPAQKKEMPPPPTPDTHQFPKIVTEQYNNHTYNNPTINYHMNNVPYPFFPCTSLTYFPQILVPINSTTTFDVNVMNNQATSTQQVPPPQENVSKIKKEKRSRKRKKD